MWNYEQVVVGPKNIKVSIDAKNKRKIWIFPYGRDKNPLKSIPPWNFRQNVYLFAFDT